MYCTYLGGEGLSGSIGFAALALTSADTFSSMLVWPFVGPIITVVIRSLQLCGFFEAICKTRRVVCED